jgi:hypothetical protein
MSISKEDVKNSAKFSCHKRLPEGVFEVTGSFLYFRIKIPSEEDF